MAKKLIKHKNRRPTGPFSALPFAVQDSPNFCALSAYGVKLLINLFGQYRGANNGDLCAAWSIMQPKGWRSKATLSKALKELRHYGFIVVTRQGGRKLATLYAVTWLGIDECSGKLDVSSSPTALRTWSTTKAPFSTKMTAPENDEDEPLSRSGKVVSLPLPRGHVGTPAGSEVPIRTAA
ncbi:hypothetical protein [Denitromonas ohlonensis]|uniref:Helix-turn-helix domain-containing protein n=2 Tax=Denitromonas TaxID=139331 RepID=A0A557S4E9_9RHOO|nr:hypothetical protein [Denitromonas ohlonensis]TVO60556.1 hypothetical protein FHP90_17870 [Denitromonas ohlonensis]TVO72286.1 hypothetical protein FHP89_18570 [Denitromonas ohlonensis]